MNKHTSAACPKMKRFCANFFWIFQCIILPGVFRTINGCFIGNDPQFILEAMNATANLNVDMAALKESASSLSFPSSGLKPRKLPESSFPNARASIRPGLLSFIPFENPLLLPNLGDFIKNSTQTTMSVWVPDVYDISSSVSKVRTLLFEFKDTGSLQCLLTVKIFFASYLH